MALSCESETRESYYMAPEKQSVILDDMTTARFCKKSGYLPSDKYINFPNAEKA